MLAASLALVLAVIFVGLYNYTGTPMPFRLP